jgi:hypothetical protein
LKLAGWGALASGLPALQRAVAEFPKVLDHTLTAIAGKPRERGKRYSQKFKEAIHSFRDKEVYCARQLLRGTPVALALPP